MQAFARFLLALALVCVAGCASAQSAPGPGLTLIGTVTGCSPPVSLDFTLAGSSCFNSSPVTPPLSGLANLTHSGAAVSGTGATGITATVPGGLVVAFSSGAERLVSGSGCLCAEPATTNLTTNSQDFTQGSWTKDSITVAGSLGDPEGGSTADTLTATATSTVAIVDTARTASATTQYSVLHYVKHQTETAVCFNIQDQTGSNFSRSCFTLTGSGSHASDNCGGTFSGCSFTIIALSGGWYEIQTTFTTGSGTTSLASQEWMNSVGGAVTVGQHYGAWGWQTEAGAGTSYVPTTSAAVTRSADAFSLTGVAGSTAPAGLYYGVSSSQIVTCSAGTCNLAGAISGGTNQFLTEFITQDPNTCLVAPGPAQTASFCTRTFATTAFSTANVDMSSTFAPGFQWYPANCLGSSVTTANTTINVDTSITQGQGGNTFNYGLASVACIAGTPFYVGHAFGGGAYVQFVAKWPTPTSSSIVNGWPAVWTNSYEHYVGHNLDNWPTSATGGTGGVSSTTLTVSAIASGGLGNGSTLTYSGCSACVNLTGGTGPGTGTYTLGSAKTIANGTAITATGYLNYFEGDICENFLGNFSDPLNQCQATNHNWFGINSAGNDQSFATHNFGAASDMSNYHTYAMLWKTAASGGGTGTIIYYIDGVSIGSQTYTTYNGATQVAPPTGQTWDWGVIDATHLMLIFGSNNSFPVTVSDVEVWQANSSQNVSN